MKPTLQSLILMLGLMLLTAPAHAQSDGGSNGGGGDPYATQFIQIGRYLQSKQAKDPIDGVEVSAVDIKERLDKIESSLEGHSPLVVFPPGETVDCFGSPKFGCVGTDGIIRIAHEGWRDASLGSRIEVSVMELFMSMDITGRYTKADYAARAIAPELEINSQGFMQIVDQKHEKMKQCATVITDLTSYFTGYKEALLSCRQYPPGTHLHDVAADLARSIEAAAANATEYCLQVCGEDKAVVCSTEGLSGACPQ